MLADGQRQLVEYLDARVAAAATIRPSRCARGSRACMAQARDRDAAEATRPFAINGDRLADRVPRRARGEPRRAARPARARGARARRRRGDDAELVHDLALARMNDAIAHRRVPDRREVQHLVEFCLAGIGVTRMEREVLITGIGGQGVQLAAQVLARAATLEGREVMYLGLYGGMMRGGNTDSTVVVGDGPIAGAAGRVAHVVGDRDARRVLGAGRAEAAARRPRARERRDVHDARSPRRRRPCTASPATDVADRARQPARRRRW